MKDRKTKRRVRRFTARSQSLSPCALWHGEADGLLSMLRPHVKFDLVLTSPPYNLGKEYEDRRSFKRYLRAQADFIERVVPRIKETGSLCWQVGNYVENGYIEPLDLHLHSLFKEAGLVLRNRIIWHFGHGLHCKRRFSGRYEVILWYSKSDKYVFNLDAVRIPSKYPGKRNASGRYTGHPAGKNPEDVWDIPNIVGNHREKTVHPCQFPVGLAQRLVLALTNSRGLVFDPFCGVGSTGVASVAHGRRFLGSDISKQYIDIAEERLAQALGGKSDFRPHDQPIFDHRRSRLSLSPRDREESEASRRAHLR